MRGQTGGGEGRKKKGVEAKLSEKGYNIVQTTTLKKFNEEEGSNSKTTEKGGENQREDSPGHRAIPGER